MRGMSGYVLTRGMSGYVRVCTHAGYDRVRTYTGNVGLVGDGDEGVKQSHDGGGGNHLGIHQVSQKPHLDPQQYTGI